MTTKREDAKPVKEVKADVRVLRNIDHCIDAVEIFQQKIGRLHPGDMALDVRALSDMIEGAVLFAKTLIELREYARKLKPLGQRTYTVREAQQLAGKPEEVDEKEWEDLNADWTPEQWAKWEKECDELEAQEAEAKTRGATT